jgi:hypothetical protein
MLDRTLILLRPPVLGLDQTLAFPLRSRRLAAATEVSRSPCQTDAFDSPTAAGTRRAGLAVNPKLPLVLPFPARSAYVVANRGTSTGNRPPQHLDDGPAQALGFLQRQLSSGPRWADPRDEQRFIGINVSNSSDNRLVQ